MKGKYAYRRFASCGGGHTNEPPASGALWSPTENTCTICGESFWDDNSMCGECGALVCEACSPYWSPRLCEACATGPVDVVNEKTELEKKMDYWK